MKYLYFAIATLSTISAHGLERSPLNVSVYYESHCPDSRDFIIKQLHPYFCKVQEYINLNLVPFGKAYSTDSGFICQHGPKECRGNTIHNCVLKRLQDPKAQVDYVNCAMYNPDQPGHIEQTCVEASGVNVEEVYKCFTSQEGYQLMLNAEKETTAQTPGPLFVPTIIFDNVYDEDNQNNAFNDFETTLCQKLDSRGQTDVCYDSSIVSKQTC